jgi:RNA-binding protein
MMELRGAQRKHLRGLANLMQPIVYIGKNGLSEAVIAAISEGMDNHELIKIKFLEFKDQRKTLVSEIESKTGGHCVGVIGHVAIFYRQQRDPGKRIIKIPD